jgi:hypothetical protein
MEKPQRENKCDIIHVDYVENYIPNNINKEKKHSDAMITKFC